MKDAAPSTAVLFAIAMGAGTPAVVVVFHPHRQPLAAQNLGESVLPTAGCAMSTDIHHG